jgi:hypothetical protein
MIRPNDQMSDLIEISDLELLKRISGAEYWKVIPISETEVVCEIYLLIPKSISSTFKLLF